MPDCVNNNVSLSLSHTHTHTFSFSLSLSFFPFHYFFHSLSLSLSFFSLSLPLSAHLTLLSCSSSHYFFLSLSHLSEYFFLSLSFTIFLSHYVSLLFSQYHFLSQSLSLSHYFFLSLLNTRIKVLLPPSLFYSHVLVSPPTEVRDTILSQNPCYCQTFVFYFFEPVSILGKGSGCHFFSFSLKNPIIVTVAENGLRS